VENDTEQRVVDRRSRSMALFSMTSTVVGIVAVSVPIRTV
jgi:hypothetical protein